MKAWERLEREVAGRLNGRRTPGSGNKSIKGDVQAGTFLVECKQRCNKEQDGNGYYLDLKSEWFLKIIVEAREQRREPVIVASVGGIRTYYCLRESYLREEGLLAGVDVTEIVQAKKQFRLHSRHDNSYLRLLFENMDEPLILVPDYEITCRVEIEEKERSQSSFGRTKSSFSQTKRSWSRSPEQKAKAAADRKRRYQAYKDGLRNNGKP